MDVFVYGTLTNPDRVRAVLDSFVYVGPAVLEGLRVVDGEYPTLALPEDAEGSAGELAGPGVAGRLLRTDEVDALDAYEGVDDGLYVRVSVPVVEGEATGGSPGDTEGDDAVDEAAVYVGDPERLGATAEWPGEGPFAERVEAALADRPVRVRTGAPT